MKKIVVILMFSLSGLLSSLWAQAPHTTKPIDHVTIAILAKDKAHTLPLYLECIEHQTWPKAQTSVYIRTNNNNDNTATILKNWIAKVKDHYAEIYFDDSNVAVPVEKYKQHEWNYERFKVLGKIRQDSVTWAHQRRSHYFVADCDNFIKPHTIETLVNRNLPIVAPLLHAYKSTYSNYHAAIDRHGYFEKSPFYYPLFEQKIKGLIELPVIHCTYLVRYEVLDKISYDDNSGRYEYVIFSDSARKQAIPQYLDTEDVYGGITFLETVLEGEELQWLKKSCSSNNKV